MPAIVTELAHRLLKSGLQLAYLAEDELRKAEQDGGIDTAFAKVVYDLLHVCREVLILKSPDYKIPFFIDTKVISTPIVDAVGLDALFDRCAQ